MQKRYINSMYDAFTPLRKLGIDWPSVNADLNMVKENIVNNTTFVMEKDNEMISTITVRYPWGKEVYLDILSYGGLLQSLHTMDRVWSRLLKYVEEDFLRDTLKAAAVTLGTSARLHPWLLQIYKKRV